MNYFQLKTILFVVSIRTDWSPQSSDFLVLGMEFLAFNVLFVAFF